MKNLLLLLWSFLVCSSIPAQVVQNVVVEHFTNTRCSICASRNPGFYNNLNAQDNVLHLTIHPSAPYSSCILNQHNKTENDARTNYYGVYGSTPRLVIQGNVISTSADYASSALFNPFQQQTSPLALTISAATYPGDSIQVKVVVKTVAAHSLDELQLFVALVEAQLDYQAPNGETRHYDVFRKSIFSTDGLRFNAPKEVGDSIVFTKIIARNNVWVLKQLYGMGIINQSTDKRVVQAARSTNLSGSAGLQNASVFHVNVYPNPVANSLNIEWNYKETANLSVYDFSGRLVKEQVLHQETWMDVSELPKGVYQLVILTENRFTTQKIIITR